MPLPKDDTTPPVTKMNFVMIASLSDCCVFPVREAGRTRLNAQMPIQPGLYFTAQRILLPSVTAFVTKRCARRNMLETWAVGSAGAALLGCSEADAKTYDMLPREGKLP